MKPIRALLSNLANHEHAGVKHLTGEGKVEGLQLCNVIFALTIAFF